MLGLMTAMLFPEFFSPVIIGIIFFSVLVAWFYRAANKISVLVGLLCIVIGMFAYTVVRDEKIRLVQPLYNQKATVTAKVTERRFHQNGRIFYTLCTEKIVPETKIPCIQNLRLNIVTKTDFYAELHETVKFDASFSPYRSDTSYGFDSFAGGCYVKASVISQQPEILAQNSEDTFFSVLRCRIQSQLKKYFSLKQSGLLYALLLGDKSELDGNIRSHFRTAGISHIIAVSGLHLSIIVGCAFWLLKRIVRKPLFVSGITIGLILFYVFLTDFPYSVVRSAVMNILVLLALMLHRKTNALNSLGLAGLCITLVNPLAIGNIALLMSFSATFGIIVMQKTVSCFVKRLFFLPDSFLTRFLKKLVSYLAECISVSVSAVTFTMPVMIFVYKKFSVYFILSNLITTAVAPFLIVVGWIVVLLSYVPFMAFVNDILVFFEQYLCDFVIRTAEKISALPHSSVSLDNFYVELSFVCVFAVVMIFFVLGNFHIQEKGHCMILCVALITVILSFGYFMDRKTLTFHISGNANGISVVESDFDTADILLCGGDNYHYDDVENNFFDKEIHSLFVFGDKAYFSNYAMKITENYSVRNIVTYTDKENYHYLSPENNITAVAQDGKIHYEKYTLRTFTVNKKNWCYIDMLDGTGILIAPQKADCNDVPELYRKVHTVVLNKGCQNSDVISAENVLICNGWQNFVIHKSFSGGVSVWQK